MNKMIGQEYEKNKRILRRSRPVNLSYFSAKEADHFFGWDVITSIGKDSKHIADTMGNELPFHCEINLNQIDHKTAVCFRRTCTRIKHGEIISFEYDGIPDSMVDYYKQKSLIIYRMMYPHGLTLEQIRER